MITHANYYFDFKSVVVPERSRLGLKLVIGLGLEFGIRHSPKIRVGAGAGSIQASGAIRIEYRDMHNYLLYQGWYALTT